ncbi:MAG: hypothetical protein GEV06_04130 [Luteitalea sp.]|nr:hypothetical protein [Luteitalea sp.]
MNLSAFVIVLPLGFCLQATPQPVQPPAAETARAPKLEPAEQRVLEDRVLAWWKARVARDHRAMYDLYEPAYRDRVPYEKFVEESVVRSRIDLREPTIRETTPEGPEQIRVLVGFVAAPPKREPYPETFEERWVRHDGEWFKRYEPVKTPFSSIARH